MGGLVIAQAISLAYSERSNFQHLYECFVGCLFFGTPFHGSPDLQPEKLLLYAHNHYGTNSTFYKSLSEFMTPGCESLDNLRHDLKRLETLLDPKIRFHCFFETERPNPPGDAVYVTRKSAILEGNRRTPLQRVHENLVRFENENDKLYTQYVRQPLQRMAAEATRAKTRRIQRSVAKLVTPGVLGQLRSKLGGTPVKYFRDQLLKTNKPLNFALDDSLFKEWFNPASPDSAPCLLVLGPQSRGKTATALAAIEHIESAISSRRVAVKSALTDTNHPSTSHLGKLDQALLAYYFCDPQNADTDELLKSILHQLISTDPFLAVHAKSLVQASTQKNETSNIDAKMQQNETPTIKTEIQQSEKPVIDAKIQQSEKLIMNAKIPLSFENLWSVLVQMLADLQKQHRTVYFVFNNLHRLDPELASTEKFFHAIKTDILDPRGPISRKHRWMWTSRTDEHFRGHFGSGNSQARVRSDLTFLETRSVGDLKVLDLNSDKYSGEIKRAISDYAYRKLDDLRQQRHINAALFRWAWSTISAAAPDNDWVDLTCLQLRALPPDASDIHLRRILECSDCSSDKLMHTLWTKLLAASASDVEETKELLRALVFAFRDPTIEELALLCGYEKNVERLSDALDRCKPLVNLVTTTSTEHTNIPKVEFAMPEIKAHLAANLKLLNLNEEEQKRQHMLLAWKCFDALQESLVPMYEEAQSHEDAITVDSAEKSSFPPNDDEQSLIGQDESQKSRAAEELSKRGLLYAVQHWMHHGVLAGGLFAEPFVKEISATKVPEKFWQAWLYFYVIDGREFRNISNDWADFRIQHQRDEERKAWEARKGRDESDGETEPEDVSDTDEDDKEQDTASTKTDEEIKEASKESVMGEEVDRKADSVAGLELADAAQFKGQKDSAPIAGASEEVGSNNEAIVEEARGMTKGAAEEMIAPSAGAHEATSPITAGQDQGNLDQLPPEHTETEMPPASEMPASILDKLKLVHIAAAFGFEELVRVTLKHSTDDVEGSNADVFGYTPVSTASINFLSGTPLTDYSAASFRRSQRQNRLRPDAPFPRCYIGSWEPDRRDCTSCSCSLWKPARFEISSNLVR
jgi:hypothetical protein